MADSQQSGVARTRASDLGDDTGALGLLQDHRLAQLGEAAPSSKDNEPEPETAFQRLLATPEILTQIFRHLFENAIGDKVAEPRYQMGDRSLSPYQDHKMPWFTKLVNGGHLSLPQDTISVMLTSSDFYLIAEPLFYHMLNFQTYAAESFRCLFVKHIGAANTRHIRTLTMGLPHPVKTMPTRYIGRYIHLFDQQMPELSTLTITTKFGRWMWPVTRNPKNVWIECHAGLLWFAAWVPRGNRKLRFAVWDEKNTVDNNFLDDVKPDYFDDRPNVEINITFTEKRPEGLQNMADPKIIMAENALLPNEMQKPVVPAEHLLLDTWAIRRKGFKALKSSTDACRPYPYQLQINARDSEANTPAREEMSNGILAEELFLHNKMPQMTLKENAHLPNVDYLYLKAKAVTKGCDDEEMLAKSGGFVVQQPEEDGEDDEDDGDDDDDDDGWGDGPRLDPDSDFDDDRSDRDGRWDDRCPGWSSEDGDSDMDEGDASDDEPNVPGAWPEEDLGIMDLGKVEEDDRGSAGIWGATDTSAHDWAAEGAVGAIGW